MTELTRSRSESCWSDLRLDQLLAGELDAALEAETRLHLTECRECSERLAVIEAERREFLADPPALAALQKPASSATNSPKTGRLVRFVPVVGSILAAAAAALLLLRSPAATPSVVRDSPPATRAKGSGSHIGYYVARGSGTELAGPETRVHPRDRLQFFYSTQTAGYLALLSVDGERHVSVYFPMANEAARIEPGTEVPLSNSIVLDGVLGRELVYGVFCAAPFDVAPLRASLQTAPELGSVRAGCTVDKLELTKRAAP